MRLLGYEFNGIMNGFNIPDAELISHLIDEKILRIKKKTEFYELPLLMVVSKKRKEIIPNETKWAPSRKGREKLAGKEYSLRSSEDLSELPDGFRHARQEIIEEFEALIPALNGYNVSKYMRSVKVQFPFDGSVCSFCTEES